MLNKWKIFFKQLRSQRLYSRKLLPDCIAMLFVYLPIIREQTEEFVRVWNIHLIRKQPNRPHIVPGQPFQNYMFSEQKGVRDYGIPINIDKLNELREGYASYDKDAYLPEVTLEWCEQELKNAGFILPITESTRDSNGEINHLSAYIYLRESITDHLINTKNARPKLGLLLTPKGVYNWNPLPEVAVGLEEARLKDYNDQDGIQFVNEGRDASCRDEDLIYIGSDDEAEVENNAGGTGFTVDGTTFDRANGNWVINGQEYRQYMKDGYASEPEAEEEDDLEIPPVNIRRFTRH
jgi:hypothetical protein